MSNSLLKLFSINDVKQPYSAIDLTLLTKSNKCRSTYSFIGALIHLKLFLGCVFGILLFIGGVLIEMASERIEHVLSCGTCIHFLFTV